MKKQFLLIITVLFMTVSANALTASLSTQSVTPSNSFAGYDVQLLVASNGSSHFCYGTFTVSFERQQVYPTTGTWQACAFTPVTSTPTTNIQTLNKLYQIGQLNGTRFNYRVTVTFNPSAGGGTCASDPTVSQLSSPLLVDVSMTACFNLLNVISSQDVASYYGPQPVKTICAQTASINGSCSQNEQGYYISIFEFNLNTWTNVEQYYSGWVSATGEVPSLIDLNSLISQNNANTNYHPHSSFDLAHLDKVYSIGVAVGPIWNSAPQKFFKVLDCSPGKTGSVILEDPTVPITVGNESSTNQKESKFKIYPNPTDGIVTIEKKEKGVVLKTIKIFDANNSISMTKPLENVDSQKINLSSLHPGIYVVNIETNEGVFVDKLVKN